MNKRQVGSSDLHVSELGLGCMSLGTEEKKAEYIIDQSLDAGINYLDTADLYDFGENESIVGKAIKGKREQIVLATKAGNHWSRETGDWYWDPSKKYIKEAAKDSLKRLGTDYIDLYQLHGGTIEDPIDETIEAFEELKEEGLIRHYGISSIRPNVIREYVKRSNIVSVMMQYSLLDRRPEEEMLDFLYENQISVFARGPVAKGILSKHAEQKVEQKGNEGYLTYSFEELEEIIRSLKGLPESSRGLTALALQYVLYHPAMAAAVFGASSVEQLQENLSSQKAEPLDKQLFEQLQTITKPVTYEKHR
ncbi:aldo/keto reductase [Sediminibacillus massiliensis]|uniref:aldo/keto reductase n=1 Tax=Sediminibacillus massiliensis TaxID=1926277 RepID=UPI00098832DF|nr:aldo/keto reductase [Sediminibacillus massiliensis]